MCGIAGVASTIPQTDRAWLTDGSQLMAHRGPDGTGDWWSNDRRLGFAHRRLAIIDLSAAGHQPMHLAARGLSIVFNGEIYNFQNVRAELEQRGHSFQSQSDTEVILAAYAEWGTDCLTRFNGMFALAIFDAQENRLFLARDRAGEKPLFYHLDQRTLRFASELKGLLACPSLPRTVDPEALDCFLALGFIPGDRCILKGYSKLPPGNAMTFDLATGSVKVWRYWRLPDLAEEADQADEEALLDELESLLEASVGRQLVADVPVGVLLSGGTDSSLITALAVRNASDVRTFSIGFPGHGKLDETPHARLVASHFGTRHTELFAEPTTADILPRLAYQFDEPMADSSMIPTWIVSELVRKHCTVALGGDGGDELFGGYDHYNRMLWMRDQVERIPMALRRGISSTVEHLIPPGMKGRNYLQGMGTDFALGLPIDVAGLFDRTTRARLMRGSLTHPFVGESVFDARIPNQQDLLQRSTRMDFTNYLAEDILVKVDRASMLSSVEMRAPMLDHGVVEFAFGKVPTRLKASTTDKKVLLKKLCERLLPREFDRQRKQGFSIPLSSWLKAGPFRDLFNDVLTDADCVFDRSTVQHLFKWQTRGCNNGERLFALAQFELWRRHYRVTI